MSVTPPEEQSASTRRRAGVGEAALILGIALGIALAGVGIGLGLEVYDLRGRVDEVERELDSRSAFVAIRSQDNPEVPQTNEFTELVTLELPPGRYQVFGKVGLHNRDPQAPFRVQCGLVPSNEDGTPREPGELGSDWGFLHLAPSGGSGEEDEISVFADQELSRTGSVVLGCSGYGNSFGALTSYPSIRAIRVDSLETEFVTPPPVP